ncbi:RNA polymerase sigma factor [Goodfellowiella coeruleoviolacea]|uniref:RNA polymerase sigma-70 factor, ECF subfamily n=1 Tax=Goodfellowiella coeruleoviolacea TaxID=334858 RepID=A0AAE3KF03_9PSEU|nr:sigma-70 family RNA polymerase sigma factor [Goodfellowiella coeruleoviolacea]MCP2163939.1 RNA polymerase sigma-70 factor, ECF subfamily [Goodfellowiella coeruleoviolacea]
MTNARNACDDGRPSHDQHTDYKTFYDKHYLAVLRYVRGMAPHLDAVEITADAFSRVWETWDRPKGERRAWLFAIAKNLARSALRSRSRDAVPVELTDSHDVLVAHTADIETRQEYTDTMRAIRELPDHLRDAIVLNANGLSPQEIGQVLGCSPRTASSYVSRARRLLAARADLPTGRLSRRRPRDSDQANDPGDRETRGEA